MKRYDLLSPRGRASGLGSANAGFGNWWMERVTSIALVPLTIWFAGSLITRSSDDYNEVIGWLGSPLTVILMVLLLTALFWHIALGLQVVIDDYIHSAAKIWVLLTVRFACLLLGLTGIIANLYIAFGVPMSGGA